MNLNLFKIAVSVAGSAAERVDFTDYVTLCEYFQLTDSLLDRLFGFRIMEAPCSYVPT